jgi:hypothetical protein
MSLQDVALSVTVSDESWNEWADSLVSAHSLKNLQVRYLEHLLRDDIRNIDEWSALIVVAKQRQQAIVHLHGARAQDIYA